jgi:FixJ family two-component response regulator
MNTVLADRDGIRHLDGVSSRVMIVEDDRWVCSAIARLVKSDGLLVEAFTSAEDFLQADRVEDAACLILDVRLPGMSGLELQRALTAGHKPVPIIFVSACSDSEILLLALKAGAVAFLTKPFMDDVLLSTIHAAVHNQEI